MKVFVRLAGCITFLVLLVYAFLFYQERTLTFDLAFQDFYIVITKCFVINAVRFGSIVPQIFPLIFRWLECPLKQILVAHSMGFAGFYFCFFLVITFFLKQHWVALIFLLSQLLLVNDTFYWIQSEFPQGIAYLILYYAYLEKKGVLHISKHYALHFLLLLLIQFFHPLMIAPILYIVLYSLYKQYQFDLANYVKPVSIVIINFFIRFTIGKFNGYESSRLSNFDGLIKNLPNLFHLPSTQKLLHFAASDYLMYWILLGVTLIILLIQNRYFIAILLSGFTVAHLLLICTTNSTADKFYLENLILPIGIFLLLPLTDFVLKKIENYKFAFVSLLIIIIATRLVFIFNAHSLYTGRLVWYSSTFKIMEQKNTQRMILSEKRIPMNILIMTWASGYESLMLSSLDGPDMAKSLIIDENLAQFDPYIKNDTTLLTKWGAGSIKDIPSNYFNIKPGLYVVENH